MELIRSQLIEKIKSIPEAERINYKVEMSHYTFRKTFAEDLNRADDLDRADNPFTGGPKLVKFMGLPISIDDSLDGVEVSLVEYKPKVYFEPKIKGY